jgi:hypothetical protein
MNPTSPQEYLQRINVIVGDLSLFHPGVMPILNWPFHYDRE